MSSVKNILFADPDTVIVRDQRFHVYLTEEEILARVDELGQEISQDYSDSVPILIGVLNGAFMFTADLMRSMRIDCEVDFLKLSSYGARKVSTGDVRELKKIDADLEGRHVILIEDIVDTGLSMQFIIDRMADYRPESVAVATLLHKKEATRVEVQLDYVGFEIPNEFVIGYGLDWGQVGRNLRQIYIAESS